MAAESQAEIISLLKELKRQVTFLEKKIDALSTEKPQRLSSYNPYSKNKGGSSRKPFNKDKQDDHSSEKKSQPSRWYEKKRADGKPMKGKPKTYKKK